MDIVLIVVIIVLLLGELKKTELHRHAKPVSHGKELRELVEGDHDDIGLPIPVAHEEMYLPRDALGRKAVLDLAKEDKRERCCLGKPGSSI